MNRPGERRRAAALTLAVALAGAAPARPDAIDDYLTAEMSARAIPGLALAVVRDGELARVSSYGLAHVETGAPVGEAASSPSPRSTSS